MPAAAAKPPALPAEAAAPLPADAVIVGRVEGAWSIRGALRIAPYGDASDSVLTVSRRWWLRRPAPAAGERAFDVASARRHSGAIVAQLRGVDDRDAAQALKGAEVLVSRADFPSLAADEYYWVDLVGCEVVNPAGETLGVVTGLDDHGAHAILRVRDSAANTTPNADKAVERLIPFVPAYIVDVDLGARRIVADWGRDY
ncbi:MAG: ribosome maturation factor RimM [Burkholderiaceae bacterium]